ncbi:YhgE/Pip domain-containing protein [Corynebacterium sanguinis]|uniref:YhgE/Pip domain-containing protein n=1 Tax=Corynebacterium sanguinis TaxID=2594913 RepID=UPI0011A88A35|nr:YhgE/Pip domain-containing protein [Corynebacterium sanguinis]MCT1555158.1 YhgE/Pip domain-containing protein [Corynebacterium sanguinis]MCT2047017.1 YhgE/Pip domain-containing protein [Corynebacterium sanguinis]MCT2155084.1 YhgE/Pip domain-containing protein [Corynebacterium sanguinis]TVS25326.1 YhgE/Pip domain-containing protein [Corynebacterium sanguinis]
MRKSGQILGRDLRRLLRVPRAFIIIVGVLITPALYAWFNINAFWEPYDHTQNIRIAVVNNDRGASTDLVGEVDVGEQIAEQLRDNDKIGWVFLPEDEARDGLMRGDYYAMFLIPPEFSEDLLSLVSGTYTQPVLEYYVNEKSNGVAPSITDAGASAVDAAVSSAFKQKVGEAAATELRETGLTLRDNADEVRGRAAGSFADIAAALDAAQLRISTMKQSVSGARPVVGELSALVESVDDTLGSVDSSLGEAEGIIAELQSSAAGFTADTSTALVESTNALSLGAASANSTIAGATDQLGTAQGRVRSAISEVDGVVEQGESATAQLRALSASAALSPEIRAQLDSAASALEERTTASRTVLDGLNEVDRSTGAVLASISELGTSLEDATSEANAAARAASQQIGESVPALNASLAQASGSVASARGALNSQRALRDETISLLAGVDNQLAASLGILDDVSGNLGTLADGARSAQSDINALLATSDSGALNTVTNLNPAKIGEYISSPVTVEQQAVFPTENYGSSMASFFTNLALWIGAFMLTIIFRVEVDTEGFRRLTVGQAYLGRFLLFATLSVLQAVVVTLGNAAFGVQMQSFTAFLATAIVTGVAYTGIIYSIVSALGHIGRGIAVFLVVIQIPGASGLYPIELMPGFFRRIYPFLPFRYGIDAMRETIAGFYGYHYFRFMATLLAMSAVAFALGWLFRLTSSHANLLFNRQLARTNLITNEKVEVMGSPYRASDIMAALSDREEFRGVVEKRARMLRENYRTLIFGGIGAGVLGIAIITLLTMLLPTDKTIMLAIVVGWSLLVILYLGAVEYFTQSLVDAEQVSLLGEAELRDAVIHRHDSAGTSVTIRPTGGESEATQ